MDDRLPDATFYASAFAAPSLAARALAAPADAVSSARLSEVRHPNGEERFFERPVAGCPVVEQSVIEHPFAEHPSAPEMLKSEFSVSDKIHPNDAFAASEPLPPVSPFPLVAPTVPKAQEPWRERILLVEDEADIRNLLLHTLQSWGYSVRMADDGEQALSIWRDSDSVSRPELILTDVQMPGLSGLELLRQVRADDPDMPVIVMTAFSSNQALTRALRLHANDFVAKPIEIPELQTALDRALRARRHREELDSERTRAARLQAVLETATAVNHEINNPLASISASAQLLRYHLDKHRECTVSTQIGGQTLPGEQMDIEAVNRLLDVILEQCDRIADFNRKLSGVVNPVTRSSGGHRMLDVDSSR